MITAAGIPTIDGDMDALAAHARGISEFGADFAASGERMNATWQGLAAVYEAPEAGQLLAAMGPVQAVSASVGEDHQTVGRVLDIYAAEVREIKARLEALRAQAGAFEASVESNDGGVDDQAKLERSDELLRAVNQTVADFGAAERRCANAISALYGGQQYRVSDGDGRHERGEYGATAEQLNAAAEGGALPWGSATESDRGLLGDLADWYLGNAGWMAWSMISGGAGALHGAFQKWGAIAARKGGIAARWGGLLTNPALSAAFREGAAKYANTVGRRAAEAARNADSAARALGNLGKTRFGKPALGFFEATPADRITATTGPLAKVKPLASKIPYVGVGTAGAQVVQSAVQGEPVGKAAAGGVASFAAGAVGTSATTSALVAAGVAAGPAGWIGVGAGVAVSVGVGYVVEHHGDEIANFAGDVWESTGDKLF